MEIEVEVVVDAPASAAWAVIGPRFGDIGEWAASIESSSLDGDPRVGAERACRIPRIGPIAAGVIGERLLVFDPMAMTLTYEAVAGLPAFIGRALNRWSVLPDGDRQCRVRTHATLELRGAMRLVGFAIRRHMRRVGVRALEELRYYIEEGCPHPRKAAARGS